MEIPRGRTKKLTRRTWDWKAGIGPVGCRQDEVGNMKGNPLTIRVLEAGEYIAADCLQWGTAVCRLNEWVEERLVESMEIMTRHVYRWSDNQWGSTVLNHLPPSSLPYLPNCLFKTHRSSSADAQWSCCCWGTQLAALQLLIMIVQFCFVLLAFSSMTVVADTDCEELIKPMKDLSRVCWPQYFLKPKH